MYTDVRTEGARERLGLLCHDGGCLIARARRGFFSCTYTTFLCAITGKMSSRFTSLHYLLRTAELVFCAVKLTR